MHFGDCFNMITEKLFLFYTSGIYDLVEITHVYLFITVIQRPKILHSLRYSHGFMFCISWLEAKRVLGCDSVIYKALINVNNLTYTALNHLMRASRQSCRKFVIYNDHRNLSKEQLLLAVTR